MLSTVLFEIGLEELPSAAVRFLGEALINTVEAAFLKRNIHNALFSREVCFAAPRRLAIRFKIPTVLPSQVSRRQGPSYTSGLNDQGEPTPALLGFSRACGVDWEQLLIEENEKGKWFVHETSLDAQPIISILPEVLSEAIHRLPLAKPMRWGGGEYAFVRPVHWILFLIEDQVIDLNLFGCTSDQKTYGHRFHSPQAIFVPHANDYESLLKRAYVQVDFYQRQKTIQAAATHLALSKEGVVSLTPALLEEVTAIVEWPVAELISFDPLFIQKVPKEALVAAMELHQKCFPIYKDETLLPYCITMTNLVSHHKEAVIQGNQRVIHARLRDALFFFQQDKQVGLDTFASQTKNVIFQEKLGTLQQKTKRLQKIVIPYLKENEKIAYQKASALSKADLMSSMVGEFPELEGVMGYYYAQAQNEEPAIAIALKDQYYPRFSKDQLPETRLGQCLSLADRLDTLVGIFSIGLKPTAVKDPFKLRRHAIAIIRLLSALQSEQPIFLSHLLQSVAQAYEKEQGLKIEETVLLDVHAFILDRLPAVYAEKNTPSFWIEAVRTVQSDDFFDFHQRILALSFFMQCPEHELFLAVSKRIEGILQHIDQTQPFEVHIDETLFEKKIEQDLYDWVKNTQKKYSIQKRVWAIDYEHYLETLLNTHSMMDLFFSDVMVFVDDNQKRNNRLALLKELFKLFNLVFNVSCFAAYEKSMLKN